MVSRHAPRLLIHPEENLRTCFVGADRADLGAVAVRASTRMSFPG